MTSYEKSLPEQRTPPKCRFIWINLIGNWLMPEIVSIKMFVFSLVYLTKWSKFRNYIIIIAVVAVIITLIFDRIAHINETTYSLCSL